ncbi:MAG: hypothetical protein PHI13_15560 [Methylococcales bacterium]|nr:hypothetical protein [Methylococcales bacterium]
MFEDDLLFFEPRITLFPRRGVNDFLPFEWWQTLKNSGDQNVATA